MKVIVAGTRTVTDPAVVEKAIADSGFEITTVLCGEARGVDLLGRRWAEARSIPVLSFPADWRKHGRAAGPIRNTQMAREAGPEGGLIAIWDRKSRGTADMIHAARLMGLAVYVHFYAEGKP